MKYFYFVITWFIFTFNCYADHIFYSIGTVYDLSMNNKYLVFKNLNDYFAVENMPGIKKDDMILVEHVIRYMPECDCTGLINDCEYEVSCRILYIIENGELTQPEMTNTYIEGK